MHNKPMQIGKIKIVSKSTSPVWKKLNNFKGKIKTSGSGRNKRYFQWDHTHSDIEVYNHQGIHMGSMHPITGELYKPPVKGRKLKF